jgi:hypothetical protein
MRVKTTVGTPRCGVRSAQRADPTIRARQAICVISAPKITPNVLENLNMTQWEPRFFMVEISLEVGHGNLVIHNRAFDLDTSQPYFSTR